jgi:hypothetical protein
MTPEIEREHRATQILRHMDLYGSDTYFRKMVDNTIYLTHEQQEQSQLAVDAAYGNRIDEFREIESRREYGA